MCVPAVVTVFAAVGSGVLASCTRTADTPPASESGQRVAVLPKADGPGKLPDSTAWTVTAYGIGALRAGMSFKAATDSLKGALMLDTDANVSECNYARWRGAPPGVLVMVDEGKIARVDIDSAGVTTREGAGVGMTEAAIKVMYPGRLSITPHAYSVGNYLSLRPLNPADSLYRIVFESENGVITHFRSGLLPNVEYVEGCS